MWRQWLGLSIFFLASFIVSIDTSPLSQNVGLASNTLLDSEQHINRVREHLHLTMPGSKAVPFSHRCRVEEMTTEELTDLLKLSYSPNSLVDGGKISSAMLAKLIADNFVTLVNVPDESQILARKAQNYRYLLPSPSILSSVEADERLVSYLGFSGCLQIIQLIVSELINIAKLGQAKGLPLKVAVLNLADFFEFVLKAVVPDYFSKGTRKRWFCRKVDESCFGKYYKDVIMAVSFRQIVTLNGWRLGQVLLDHFRTWLSNVEIVNIYLQLKPRYRKKYFRTLRSLLTHMTEMSRVFIDPTMYQKLYQRIDIGSMSDIDSYKLFYVNSMPILRALMMIDDLDEIRSYLGSFFEHLRLSISPSNQVHLLLALDSMMADAKFVKQAVKKKAEAFAVLELIFRKLDLSFTVDLPNAIRGNLFHLTESILLLTNVGARCSFDLITVASKHFDYECSVELLLLVVAYCFNMDSKKLYEYASTIDLGEQDFETYWLDANQVHQYNLLAAVKHVITRTAKGLKSLEENVQFCSKDQILLPHPEDLYDSPVCLYLCGRIPAPADSYPFHDLYNFMQLILLRRFGITFAQSRVIEQMPEFPNWSDILSFGNFMIEIHRPDETARFSDPSNFEANIPL